MPLDTARDATFLLLKCAGKKASSLFHTAAARVAQEHRVILHMGWYWLSPELVTLQAMGPPVGLFTDVLLFKWWWRPRALTLTHIWAAPDSVNRPNQRYLCWSVEPFWKKVIYFPSSPRKSHMWDSTGAAKTRSCALICTLPTIFQLLRAQSPSSAGLSFVYVFDCSPMCDWRRGQRQGQLLSVGFSQCVVHTEPPS